MLLLFFSFAGFAIKYEGKCSQDILEETIMFLLGFCTTTILFAFFVIFVKNHLE